MTKFFSLLLTGAVSGGIYAIFASGMVLNYTTTRVFNFAYGAIAFATAYVYYQLDTGLGWPIVPAAVGAVVVFAPAFGYLLDVVLFRKLSQAPAVARIVTTIGLLVALPSATVLLASWLKETVGLGLAADEQVFLPPGIGPTPPTTWKIAEGVTLDSNQLAVFIAAVVVSLLLWYVIRHTALGLRLRATVDRRELASLRGIDPGRSSAVATVLSTALAGLAGVLIAPLFNLESTIFTLLMFVAAAGAVLGGLRSIPLAMLGGILLGVVQSMVAGYVDISPELVPGLRSSVPFVLMLVGLFYLGRERGRAAGVVADDPPPPDYLADLPPWRRWTPWFVAVVALVVFVQSTDDFNAGIAAKGIAVGIIFLSFVPVTGMGGMVSLAQSAFAMTGAVTSAILVEQGWPFFLAAIAGALVAVAVGIVVAVPSLRLGGLALALATLAMGFMADQMVFQIEDVNGGSLGRSLPRPALGDLDFVDDRSYAMLLLALFGVVALVVVNIMRSPTGRATIAVRSSEVAAATAGASALRAKFVLFGLSAAIAAFGGTLLASTNYRISSSDYTTSLGLVWLAVAVVFGLRRVGGALVGGFMFAFTPEIVGWFTDSKLWPPILFGLGAINLAQNPDGVLALFGQRRYERRTSRRVETANRVAAELSAEAQPDVPAVVVERGMASGELGADSAAVLELRGIVARYDEVEVLHGVDLRVPEGAVVALLGANGAGKSTLCAVVAGLMAPSEGTVVFDGEDVTRLAAHRRARRGVLLAPEFRGIFPGLSVEENVAVSIRDDEERDRALSRFPRLLERRKVTASLLSGGEQQMLTLASALERPPRLLIADEPSLGLAPLAAARVFETVADLRERGSSILLVEEKARTVLDLADYVVVLEVGHVRWAGPAADIDEAAVRELYLGASL